MLCQIVARAVVAFAGPAIAISLVVSAAFLARLPTPARPRAPFWTAYGATVTTGPVVVGMLTGNVLADGSTRSIEPLGVGPIGATAVLATTGQHAAADNRGEGGDGDERRGPTPSIDPSSPPQPPLNAAEERIVLFSL